MYQAEQVLAGDLQLAAAKVEVERGGEVVLGTDVCVSRERGHGDGVLVQDWNIAGVTSVHNPDSSTRGCDQAREAGDKTGAQDGLYQLLVGVEGVEDHISAIRDPGERDMESSRDLRITSPYRGLD